MRFACSILVLAGGLGLGGYAEAQEPFAGLSAPEQAQVAAAIDAAKEDGSRAAVNALRDRIEEGLSPALLDRAVDALVAIGRGPASRALEGMVGHRRVQVRAKVAAGLVSTRAPGARRRLVQMLDDPSPVVRSAAAHALGELGATASMRDLIAAAAAGNAEAAGIVVAEARPPHVTRMLREVNAETLETYASMLRELAAGDRLPTRTRLAILSHLAEIGTGFCHHLLQELVDALPEGDEVATAAAEALGEVEAREEEAREAAEAEAAAVAEREAAAAAEREAAAAAEREAEAEREAAAAAGEEGSS